MSSIPLILPDNNPHERLLLADEDDYVDINADQTDTDVSRPSRHMYSRPPRRHASLLPRDIVLSAVLTVQLISFVHVLAARWTFPETWLRRFRWINLIALDPWQFSRLQTTGAYISVAGGETDSSLAPFSYRYVLGGWLAIYVLLVVGYSLGMCVAGVSAHPDTARRVARVRRLVYIVIQVVALPSATAVARLLHCRSDDTVDTMNQLSCYQVEHWCYLLVGVVVLFTVQLVVAWRMRDAAIHNLRADSTNHRRHEQLLRQRALEYENAVDMSWRTDGYEWFASFSHRATLTRPFTVVASLVVNAVYAFSFNERFIEATLLTAMFAVVLLITSLSPPYRVSICNYLLWAALSSATVACVLGSLITGSQAGSNVWLQPYYLNRLLSAVYGVQMALWVVVLIYLVCRHCLRNRRKKRRGMKSMKWLCCGPMRKTSRLLPASSLWPTDNPKPMHRKYIYDIKRARNLIGLYM